MTQRILKLLDSWLYLMAIHITIHYCSLYAGLLGFVGREPARQTSRPGSNPSWDVTACPVCETFNVMRVFKNHYIKCTVTGPITG